VSAPLLKFPSTFFFFAMDPFVGEIRIMPYSFITNGWAQCSGQLLAINRYTALFALLGTTYGGDGRTTFALPNLNGRAVVGAGQGPGLSSYPQGTVVGTETVTLNQTQLPAHTHAIGPLTVPVNSANATVVSPAGAVFAEVPGSSAFGGGTANGPMAAGLLSGTTDAIGSSTPHENRMPHLALSYVIALQGVFPQRQ
jgi:microcystin-dependent protein